MKKILILEDNFAVRNYVCKLVEQMEIKIETYPFQDVKDAYECALEKNIDCFIVDIILSTKVPGDVSGLKFIERIRQIQKYILTPVIVITSLDDAKMYSYDKLHCYGFLEKPFSPEALQNMIEEIFGCITGRRSKTLVFSVAGIMMSVECENIIYVEVARRMLVIHTKRNGIIEVPYKTMKEFMIEADSEDFVRCSRYCAVNRNYIKSFDVARRILQLKDCSDVMYVGKNYKKTVEESMKRL